MIPSYLDPHSAALFFHTDNGHSAVPLVGVGQARILWLNTAVIKDDPKYRSLGGDVEAYERHLLSTCARFIPSGLQQERGRQVDGVADRYGGSGIGCNGGSGRAVIIGEYLVKGCGRTPLVGESVDPAHGSGGAYLEESVRETIFSEIVRREFPLSSVPTLAIIDTGVKQVWTEPDGTKHEWRTLLIRPNFLRPAHFERAIKYHAADPLDGAVDAMRVERMFQSAVRLMGKEDFSSMYRQFWVNWAAQLAYSFAHRLPHGSNTTSNVAFDGALLDFGAMSSVPSWGNIATMRRYHPFGTHLAVLRGAIKSIEYYFQRYFASHDNIEGLHNDLLLAAAESYDRTLTIEVLRTFGLTRSQAAHVTSTAGTAVSRAVSKIISFFQREKIDFCDQASPLALEFDIARIWDADPPQHLTEIRALIDRHCPGLVPWQARSRCMQLCEPRTLYREEMRKNIHERIDFSSAGIRADVDEVCGLIDRTVVKNRRDHMFDIDDGITIGFASSGFSSYVIFMDCSTYRLFALEEKRNCESKVGVEYSDRISVEVKSPDSIELLSGDGACVKCDNVQFSAHYLARM